MTIIQKTCSPVGDVMIYKSYWPVGGFIGFCDTQGHEGFCFLHFFITSYYKLPLVKQVFTSD